MSEITQLLEGGGLLAFAGVVWYELRRIREILDRNLSDIAADQRMIAERQETGTREILTNISKLPVSKNGSMVNS